MSLLAKAVLLVALFPATLSATQFAQVLPQCQFSHRLSPYRQSEVARIWKAMELLGAAPSVASLLAPIIVQKATLFHIDPLVMVSIARQETRFRLGVRGSKGEVGVFQIMPSVWCEELGLTEAELEEPGNNAHACAYILAKYLRTYGGDMRKAVRAYNHRAYGASYAKQVLRRHDELVARL